MGQRKAKVLDINGKFSETPDFPVAVVREAYDDADQGEGTIVDPVFSQSVTRNLYGRIMTLVEVITPNEKLEATKNVFSKELMSWENDVYRSARDLSRNQVNPDNIYTR